MTRGFASIGLQYPKTDCNVSQVMRLCSCYDVSMLAITGNTILKIELKLLISESVKTN